jgi:hypothetical protein
MSDRKYRQRGYQDDGAKDRERPRPGEAAKPRPRPEDRPPGPRTLNMPGFRTVTRCHRCATIVNVAVIGTTACAKCGAALHCCAQCESFNPAARFECMQPISARVSPKDAVNACERFEPRATVERETGSVRQSSARNAFDDLFKI